MQTLTISDQAASRIATLVAKENSPDKLMLRLSVLGGGCSGFQYSFSFDTIKAQDDITFEKDGITVVVDEASLALLDGAVVDYVEELGRASFVVKNPNASSKCGCGNSFSI